MTTLAHESLLQLLAEISVAFVGFSMLASAFRSNRGDDFVRFADLRNVAETGLLAMIGSLLPLLLHAVGCPTEWTWRVSSAVLAVLWTAGATAANRRQGYLRDRMQARPVRIAFVHGLSALVVVLGIANMFFPGTTSGGRHVLQVSLCILQSAQLFLLAGFEGTDPPRDDDGA